MIGKTMKDKQRIRRLLHTCQTICVNCWIHIMMFCSRGQRYKKENPCRGGIFSDFCRITSENEEKFIDSEDRQTDSGCRDE